MGLAVSYDLALPPPATFDDAVNKIRALHLFASRVGFSGYLDRPAVGPIEVGGISGGQDCDFVEDRSEGSINSVAERSLRWVRFITMPGRGTETATFGLEECPDRVALTDTSSATSADERAGFSSSEYCKTHYACIVDESHFLHCHKALLRLLDHALELGILADVRDAGQYWETRSDEVLLANLRRESAIVASVVGRFKDQVSDGGSSAGFVAPILRAQSFEHLELRGRQIAKERSSDD